MENGLILYRLKSINADRVNKPTGNGARKLGFEIHIFKILKLFQPCGSGYELDPNI